MKTLVLLLLASRVMASSDITPSQSCGNKAITWDGTKYTCTDFAVASYDSIKASTGTNNDITAFQQAVTHTGSLTVTGATYLGTGAHVSTMTTTGVFGIPRWTIAQLQAYTPTAAEVGGLVMCANCAGGYTLCKSTGAVIMGFQLSTGTLPAGSSPCR